ncbi:MAG: glycosyltransferase [Nitrospirae bacterium]|nr:glycosyltransferase [Nitrospirota bacterium]
MTVRIGIIEDTLLHGGTQMWSVEAARFFCRRGAEVTMISPEGGWVAAQSRDAGVNVFSYDYDDVARGNKSATQAWTTALSRCGVALCTVHPPRGSFHPSTFASWCIEQGHLPTLLLPKTGTIVPSYKREFYRPNKDISPVVIATTAFTRDYLIDHYEIPEAEVPLIYQGIDLARFTAMPKMMHASARSHLVSPRSNLTLGCIGSFEERKGQIVLLQALTQVLMAMPNAHLLLVGDGPDEAELRRAVDVMGLTNAVTFVPFTDKPEEILALLDILVLPSLYKEGLPNVILEAMAIGVPVVSSRLAGVPEAVKDGETGVLVSPGDSRELSGAIVGLWRDQDTYAQMRDRALHLVKSVFDRESRLEQYLRFLERVVA